MDRRGSLRPLMSALNDLTLRSSLQKDRLIRNGLNIRSGSAVGSYLRTFTRSSKRPLDNQTRLRARPVNPLNQDTLDVGGF